MAKIVFSSELVRGKVTVENETTGDVGVYRCYVSGFTPHMIKAGDAPSALMEFMKNIGNLQRDHAWKAAQAVRNAKSSERMKQYHTDLQEKLLKAAKKAKTMPDMSLANGQTT